MPTGYTRGVRTAPVVLRDRVTVTVDALVAGGDALCRLDGFPIFVPGLFSGDRAIVSVVEVKKGFARGEVVTLLARGPDRRVEPCPARERCGGCDWAEMRLDRQLAAKRQILSEALRRTGRLAPDVIPSVRLHASPLNYRLRSRLHRDPVTGDVGFFARRSHTVVPLPDACEVVGMATLSGMSTIREMAQTGDTIDVFESDDGLTVVERSEDLANDCEVSIRVGRWHYRLSTRSFSQVNRHLLSRPIELVGAVAAGAESKETALDLYGGIGFFALPLTEVFDEVVSVESGDDSRRFATLNLQGRPGARVLNQSVEAYLETVRTRPDFVLVDPPRAGLSAQVRKELARIAPRTIAYLSCDPVTFARDVAELVGHGWRLHTLDLVDLFPNTHHVETLASLVIAD